MARASAISRRMATTGALAALGLAALASPAEAQDKQVYRYIDADGRVIYSDRLPPGDAKSVQSKRLNANLIEGNDLPLAAQQAMDRYPVTLYTFNCGDPCTQAEALLNRRGVPFTTVNVEEPKGADQLKTLTGELNAPVLQVGDTMVAKGFLESKWQSMLDTAGYPKTPSPRRAPPGPRTSAAESPPATSPQVAPVPGPGSGYPTQ